jgi:hypothetical protein
MLNAVREKVMKNDDKFIQLKLSRGQLEFLHSQLMDHLAGRYVEYNVPSLALRISLDENLPGQEFFVAWNSWQREAFHEMSFEFLAGVLPDDLTQMIRLSYAEALTCYTNECYIAAFALCGNINAIVKRLNNWATNLGGRRQRRWKSLANTGVVLFMETL